MAYGTVKYEKAYAKVTYGSNGKIKGSQDLEDLTSDKYQELRKARSVTFLKNGDLNHAPKTIQLTPHRYIGFQELQNDLTKKLNLPHGCRKIYTPRRGRQINAIEDLEDQGVYICAGFEKFKRVDYGKLIRSKTEKLDRSRARVNVPSTNLSLPNGSSHSSPERNTNLLTHVYGKPQNQRIINANHSPVRPKNILIVLSGRQPYHRINLVVNKRTIFSMDQLIGDISRALGRPKWRNDKIQRLFSIRGEEIVKMNQIFNECDVFVAVPAGGRISDYELTAILEELYPETPYQRKILKQHHEEKMARHALIRNLNNLPPMEKRRKKKYENETRLTLTSASETYEPKKTTSSNEDTLQPITRTKIPRNIQNDSVHNTRITQSLPRNGRTFTMLERNEGELRKQLYERDQQLHETSRRHEEVMQKLYKQEETTKQLQRQIDAQNKNNETDALQRISGENDARMKALESKYKNKEREIERELKRYRQKIEAEHKNKMNAERKQVEDEKLELDAQKKRMEKEKNELAEREIDQKRKDANDEIERQWKQIEEEKAKLKGQRKKAEELRIRDVRKSEDEPKLNHAIMMSDDEESVAQETSDADDTQWEKQNAAKRKPRKTLKKDDIEKRYEIGEKIGDGNFAIVYKCRKVNTQSEYALKVIDKSLMKGKEEMIENEASIMRSCDHPNIVNLLDEFATVDNIYLVIELVRGGDLFDAITESLRYDETTASALISDLTSAIAYLHARNIVHRDVKPENCLLERYPRGRLQIKLADFGLALEVKKPIYQVCGTPTYVAPEILVEGGGQGYGLEVDNWAIGVIMYILLCGFPPFRSQNRDQNELFDIIVKGEFQFLSPYWDNISESAMQLIRRLLTVNPKKRLTAAQTLKHPWIESKGQGRGHNLQRQVTLELARHKLISGKKSRGSVQAK